jgi:hypothetical protein
VRYHRIIFSIFLVNLLVGCTSVNIYSAGEVSTEWRLGFPLIKVETDGQSTVVKTQSFGFVSSPNATNIGYLNETFMVSGKECELVLFEPKTDDISDLRELVDLDNSICTSNEELHHGGS